MPRILIFDGAPAAAQANTIAHGGRSNTDMFTRALAHHATGVDAFTLNVADGERLPQGMAIGDFDGVVVTGSPLNIYTREPAVTRQIDLIREVFDAGVPCYGSCWGLQLACVALGGSVRLNPRGRELGIARAICLTPAGRAHALFTGKEDRFDALCVHQDEVETLPAGAVALASNAVSDVQAFEITRGAAHFIGVQYHPEHDLTVAAAIIDARAEVLAREGFAGTPEQLRAVAADWQALAADPARRDLAWRYGVGADVLDDRLRTRELGNWIASTVAPHAATRAAQA